MSKYVDLDKMVFSFVSRDMTTLSLIARKCSKRARMATSIDRHPKKTISSRLQVLRKAGKIECVNGWWRIVEVAK